MSYFNRYLYHYHATFQIVSSEICNIDGILSLENPITTHDAYMELKPLISPEHHDKLIITNLSFLHREKN